MSENKGRDNLTIAAPNPGKGGDPVTRLSDHNSSQDISDHMLSGKQGGEKNQKGHEQSGGLPEDRDWGLSAHACKAEPAYQAVNGGE